MASIMPRIPSHLLPKPPRKGTKARARMDELMSDLATLAATPGAVSALLADSLKADGLKVTVITEDDPRVSRRASRKP